MDITEVEALLNSLRLLGLMAPQHIFLVDEEISMQVDGKLFFRGLAPQSRSVIVISSKFSDQTTPAHELVHTLGLGEFAADLIGKLAALKYNVAKELPLSGFKLREVRYQEVDDLPSQFRGRVRHYVRV
jgi:hypothetical protein